MYVYVYLYIAERILNQSCWLKKRPVAFEWSQNFLQIRFRTTSASCREFGQPDLPARIVPGQLRNTSSKPISGPAGIFNKQIIVFKSSGFAWTKRYLGGRGIIPLARNDNLWKSSASHKPNIERKRVFPARDCFVLFIFSRSSWELKLGSSWLGPVRHCLFK